MGILGSVHVIDYAVVTHPYLPRRLRNMLAYGKSRKNWAPGFWLFYKMGPLGSESPTHDLLNDVKVYPPPHKIPENSTNS